MLAKNVNRIVKIRQLTRMEIIYKLCSEILDKMQNLKFVPIVQKRTLTHNFFFWKEFIEETAQKLSILSEDTEVCMQSHNRIKPFKIK